MSSNVPTVRQISWLSIIPQIIVIGLLTLFYHLIGFKESFIGGAFTYAFLALGLRNIIAKDQRKGMQLVKRQKFADALPHFEKSVDYFTKNSWVDKYRYLTLLSSSKMTYKEMGLCNIAFCYSQTGNGLKAKEFYELTLQEFPANGLAIASLNMIKSLEKNARVKD